MISFAETFFGRPFAILATPFDHTGGQMVSPVNFGQAPGCPCPGLYANFGMSAVVLQSGTSLFGPTHLGAAGVSFSFVWPAALGSTDILFQGLVPTNTGNSNPFFALDGGPGPRIDVDDVGARSFRELLWGRSRRNGRALAFSRNPWPLSSRVPNSQIDACCSNRLQ